VVKVDLRYKGTTYQILLFDDQVTILVDDKEYASGTWSSVGGYVRYEEDGPKSTFSWRAFDQIDKLLRVETKFKASERGWGHPGFVGTGSGGLSFYMEDRDA
jgi:hypothetical protein